MDQRTFSAVDEYVAGLLTPHDEALEAAIDATAAAGIPAIQVSTAQGRLLHLLARSLGARVRDSRRLQRDLAGPGTA